MKNEMFDGGPGVLIARYICDQRTFTTSIFMLSGGKDD